MAAQNRREKVGPNPDQPSVPTVIKVGASAYVGSDTLNGVDLVDCFKNNSMTISVSDTTISVGGDIEEQLTINDSFPAGEKTGFFIPLTLTAKDGDILTMTTLNGASKSITFGQTGDAADTMVLVLAVKPNEDSRTFKITRGTDSTDYTVDYSGVVFPA